MRHGQRTATQAAGRQNKLGQAGSTLITVGFWLTVLGVLGSLDLTPLLGAAAGWLILLPLMRIWP